MCSAPFSLSKPPLCSKSKVENEGLAEMPPCCRHPVAERPKHSDTGAENSVSLVVVLWAGALAGVLPCCSLLNTQARTGQSARPQGQSSDGGTTGSYLQLNWCVCVGIFWRQYYLFCSKIRYFCHIHNGSKMSWYLDDMSGNVKCELLLAVEPTWKNATKDFT